MIRIEVIHEARVRLIRYGRSWRKFWFVDKAEAFAVTRFNIDQHISMYWHYEDDGEICNYNLGLRIKWAVGQWRYDNEKRSAEEQTISKKVRRWRPLTRREKE